MGVIVGLVGIVVLIGVSIGTYYAISYAVLVLVGKALPLVGRRRR